MSQRMDGFDAIFVRYFNSAPDLRLYYFDAGRAQFTFAVETYAEWSLLAVERGEFAFGVGPDAGVCGFGQWVLCPPNVAFEREMRAPTTFHFARFTWDIEAEKCPLIGLNTVRDTVRLKANFAAWRELRFRRDEASERFRGHILHDLLRASWWEAGENWERNAPFDAAMQTARAFLEENFSQSVSLADLAARFRLSPVAFTRRFRAAHGLNPSQFLISARLEHARNLLLESDLTLDAVASRCGLGNGFYLSRMWKGRWGGTPSGFRRAHRV